MIIKQYANAFHEINQLPRKKNSYPGVIVAARRNIRFENPTQDHALTCDKH